MNRAPETATNAGGRIDARFIHGPTEAAESKFDLRGYCRPAERSAIPSFSTSR